MVARMLVAGARYDHPGTMDFAVVVTRPKRQGHLRPWCKRRRTAKLYSVFVDNHGPGGKRQAGLSSFDSDLLQWTRTLNFSRTHNANLDYHKPCNRQTGSPFNHRGAPGQPGAEDYQQNKIAALDASGFHSLIESDGDRCR
jgi:hypothetical protein